MIFGRRREGGLIPLLVTAEEAGPGWEEVLVDTYRDGLALRVMTGEDGFLWSSAIAAAANVDEQLEGSIDGLTSTDGPAGIGERALSGEQREERWDDYAPSRRARLAWVRGAVVHELVFRGREDAVSLGELERLAALQDRRAREAALATGAR